MSSAARRTPTCDELYAEIERLPQGVTGQILVPGVLKTMSRPGAPHEHTLTRFSRALDPFNRTLEAHGWWIRQELEVRFPGDRLVAHAVVRVHGPRERRPATPLRTRLHPQPALELRIER